jgi:hypothetical protein
MNYDYVNRRLNRKTIFGGGKKLCAMVGHVFIDQQNAQKGP